MLVDVGCNVGGTLVDEGSVVGVGGATVGVGCVVGVDSMLVGVGGCPGGTLVGVGGNVGVTLVQPAMAATITRTSNPDNSNARFELRMFPPIQPAQGRLFHPGKLDAFVEQTLDAFRAARLRVNAQEGLGAGEPH